VGFGLDLRLESESLVGFALEHEDRVVHICLFPNAGNRKAESSNRISEALDAATEERNVSIL
jgi:hypothetical protein